jgi:hypothetical protein
MVIKTKAEIKSASQVHEEDFPFSSFSRSHWQLFQTKLLTSSSEQRRKDGISFDSHLLSRVHDGRLLEP